MNLRKNFRRVSWPVLCALLVVNPVRAETVVASTALLTPTAQVPELRAPLSSDNHAALIAQIDRQSRSLKTISARLDVRIADGKREPITLSGLYYGTADGEYRMKLTGPFGITVVDILCARNTITTVLPTKKLVLKGDATRALAARMTELPLLLSVARANNLFLPLLWVEDAVERRVRREHENLLVSVLGLTGEELQDTFCMRRYSILRELCAVASQDVLAANGKPLGVINYLNHAPLHSWPKESTKLGQDIDPRLEFPRAIQILHGSGRFKVELVLQSLALNTNLPEGCFKVEMPKNAKTRDLVEVIRNDENVFE